MERSALPSGSLAMIIDPDIVFRCPVCGALMLRDTYLSYNTFRHVLWSDGYFGDPRRSLEPTWCICHGCGKGMELRELLVAGETEDGDALLPAERERDRELFSVRSALQDRSLRTMLRRWRSKTPGIEQLKEREAALQKQVFEWDPQVFKWNPRVRSDLSDIPHVARLAPSDHAHLLAHGAHNADDEKEIDLRLEYWWVLNEPVREDPELRPQPLAEHHANLKRLEELLLAKSDPDVRIVALRMELGRFEEARDYLTMLLEREETKEQRDTFNSAIEQRVDRVFRID